MPRRGPRRTTVVGVGTPPAPTRQILYPLAMEILHRWEAKQAAECQAHEGRQEVRFSKKSPDHDEP